MGLLILLIVVVVLLSSYYLYVSPKIRNSIDPRWDRSTPARRLMDGNKFFPTPFVVLAGFQLRSVSLDIIISPIIAVQFGWLPAILWLLIGAVFFGVVQDYLSTIISVRSSGTPFTQLFEKYFNANSRKLIHWFLLAYLLIIISQLSLIVASLVSRIDVPFAIIVIVLVSLVSGVFIYRTTVNILITSIFAIGIAILGIWASSTLQVISLTSRIGIYLGNLGMMGSTESIFGSFSLQILISLSTIFFICYISSILPTWRFVVPFNYLTNWLVIVGFLISLIGFSRGLFSGSIETNFELPPIISLNQPHIGPFWPILFVTLSSGAISGWHSLVSSYSTSHQVEKEPLVKPVTTIAMFGETIFVTLIIIFAATFGVSAGLFNASQNYLLSSGPASVFAAGFANTWNNLGFSSDFGASVSATLLTLMGLSVLHIAVRYARIIQTELLRKKIRSFGNVHLSSFFVIIAGLLITLFGLREWLWILFAGANMLLASLVLLFASLWLAEQNKSTSWTFLPSIFLALTGSAALFYSSLYQNFWIPIISNSDLSNIITSRSLMMLVFTLLFFSTTFYIYSTGVKKLMVAKF